MSIALKQISASIILGLSLTACQYEQLHRSEFMSESAGNAIAHNSALQIVDPWPRSAGNNNLLVPSTDYGGEPKKEAAPATPIVIQAAGGQQ